VPELTLQRTARSTLPSMLTVSRLAKQAGVRPGAIRYYEHVGLLPPPTRTQGGYRLYDEDVADRVRFIKGAQRLGLRLREIGELLTVRDRGGCPCGHTQALVERRITELDAELARLAALRAELTRLAAGCAADSRADGAWPCDVEFVQAGKEVKTP
jgi:MerR family mercuric resistance operon transcriptional regulator